jgi:pimeloyl-ACP methyl ester carboxylesterase
MSLFRRIKIAGLPEGFEERSFNTNDVILNYIVGPNNGLPLLLIPGQMESWQGYKCVLSELSKIFKIFVPDLRGHGKSTWTPGYYSYNICGEDLKQFIQQIIQKPALVGGLSSGGVLAIWLAANTSEDVLAVIAEDPPIFSSVWPRIQEEKFMAHNFQMAVEILGKPGERDIEEYFAQGGIPAEGKTELLKIPPILLKIIFGLVRINRALRPKHPYDIPLLPFSIRAPLKFLSEYDTDFSLATIDGRLSKDFSPEETMSRVKCPVLLMRAHASRHETWGLLGAIDDDDLARIESLVEDLKYVQIDGRHDIHNAQPERYVEEIVRFVDEIGL